MVTLTSDQVYAKLASYTWIRDAEKGAFYAELAAPANSTSVHIVGAASLASPVFGRGDR